MTMFEVGDVDDFKTHFQLFFPFNQNSLLILFVSRIGFRFSFFSHSPQKLFFFFLC